jgi:hypothetical protein
MSAQTRTWISTAFRIVLAFVWLYAGGVKLFQPGGAREAIIAYRIFPASWVDFLGWALPAVEVGLGALLLIGLFTRWAAIISALLFTAFIIGISSVWIRGYSIDCGCFGGGGDITESGKTWRYSSELLRDALFTGMACWLTWWPHTKFALDRIPMGVLDTAEPVTAA